MNNLPHFARFVRALAVGAAVGAATIAACTNTAAPEGTNGTTTTNGSSGNESTSSATDAGASADAAAPTASLDGTPCPTVGERRPDPRDSNSLCACGGSEGSSSWQCAQMPIPIAGPAAPPELAV